LAKGDQACDMWVETSLDGSSGLEVAGLSVTSSNWQTDKWNMIEVTAPLRYARLAVKTGSTAPSSLAMIGTTR